MGSEKKYPECGGCRYYIRQGETITFGGTGKQDKKHEIVTHHGLCFCLGIVHETSESQQKCGWYEKRGKKGQKMGNRLTKTQADIIEEEMRRLETDPTVSKRELRLFMQLPMPCGHATGNLLTCDKPPSGCVKCLSNSTKGKEGSEAR